MLKQWKTIFYSICILLSNVLDQRSIKQQNVQNTHSCLWRCKPQRLLTRGVIRQISTPVPLPPKCRLDCARFILQCQGADLLCRTAQCRVTGEQQRRKTSKFTRTRLFPDFFYPFFLDVQMCFDLKVLFLYFSRYSVFMFQINAILCSVNAPTVPVFFIAVSFYVDGDLHLQTCYLEKTKSSQFHLNQQMIVDGLLFGINDQSIRGAFESDKSSLFRWERFSVLKFLDDICVKTTGKYLISCQRGY